MPFSTDLPDPPVPADCDLTAFGGFVLNVDHLLTSELMAIATAEEFRAAVLLWCHAWKQIPAGSLPNNEKILAKFSGSSSRWPRVRVVALKGFVHCSDGRLYHRFLCEEVLRTLSKQKKYQAERKRVAEWRSRRANGADTRTVRVQNGDERSTVPDPYMLTITGTGTGTGTEGKKEPYGSSFPDSDTKEASASLDCRAHDARHPPKEERGNGGSAKRSKSKTRIAPDWQPDLADCAYAAGRGWDTRRIGEEADAFADRCKRDDVAYADWNAAWRYWCRNAEKFAARPNGEAAGRHTPARSGSFATAARNVAARYDLGDK